ncbi:RIP metalloprotease RseP [Floricoccus tropicus]|uniref:Zinc metalloprotease n=1 Tax=Floricoccus tropicus TaxID=1859473 RepID=A0A1E8GKX6_9LACT|nr:RIP metalloprotease RseP [Floricoccus tropicus]OFI48616.1 RIP metalloprotease RseP [Floricoccus tropicus]
MDSIRTIITFAIVFSVIVIVHEFGHFYFAKKSGILVREFSIGMGPKLFGHIGKDGTAYSIRLLPVGGYVRMAGWGDDDTEIKTGTPVGLKIEDGVVKQINLRDEQTYSNMLPMFITDYDFDNALTVTGEVNGESQTYPVDHDATIVESDGTEVRIAPSDVQYQNASIGGRLITNFAGPMNNFILGVVVFIIVAFLQGGGETNLNTNHLGQIAPDSPAAQAGLKKGDAVESIDGVKISNWQDLTENIVKSNGKQLDFVINRDGKEENIKLTPKKEGDRYLIGINAAVKDGFIDKITYGFTESAKASTQIIKALGDLIVRPNIDKLGGPVAMYQLSGEAARAGTVTVLRLMALLSINLGIFNLVPIPALDGGKILFVLIEAVRGKPISQEKEGVITVVAMVFMLALMVAVTWNDFMRIF